MRQTGHTQFITKRRDFTVTLLSANTMVLFGGRLETGTAGMNDMYLVTYNMGEETYVCAPIVAKKSSKVKEHSTGWPRARYGHTMTNCNGNLILFGGMDGYTCFSDLHMFDSSIQAWQEIVIDGVVPPPVSFHSSFMYSNQHLFVYGGCNQKKIYNNLYKYDIGAKVWNKLQFFTS